MEAAVDSTYDVDVVDLTHTPVVVRKRPHADLFDDEDDEQGQGDEPNKATATPSEQLLSDEEYALRLAFGEEDGDGATAASPPAKSAQQLTDLEYARVLALADQQDADVRLAMQLQDEERRVQQDAAAASLGRFNRAPRAALLAPPPLGGRRRSRLSHHDMTAILQGLQQDSPRRPGLQRHLSDLAQTVVIQYRQQQQQQRYSQDDDDDDGIPDADDYEGLLALAERLGDVKKKGAPENAIANLPRFTYEADSSSRAPSSSTVNNEDDKTCVICTDDFVAGDALIALPTCLHRFHSDCIAPALKVGRSARDILFIFYLNRLMRPARSAVPRSWRTRTFADDCFLKKK